MIYAAILIALVGVISVLFAWFDGEEFWPSVQIGAFLAAASATAMIGLWAFLHFIVWLQEGVS